MEERTVTLAHGNGGRRMHELIEALCRRFSNDILRERADAAEFHVPGKRLAFSTDSFVVRPLFFPGGDIGKLAVCGTLNDLSMKGAEPLYLSLALIIEEGLSFSILDRIAGSIARAARAAKVKIVTGDIKVVEKGAADKLFINTAGVGVIPGGRPRIGSRARIGDAVVINGSIAEHGMAVLNAREKFGFVTSIRSDCADLSGSVKRCRAASGRISAMRDLTRGGLATGLHEIAEASNLGIEIDECRIPVKTPVRKLCDVLGFDPLYVANEGKYVCFVDGKDAARVKRAMGSRGAIIGAVTRRHRGKVILKTRIGASRIVPRLEQDQLPRIC